MKQSGSDQDPIIPRKVLIILELGVIIVGFLLFLRFHNPGVILISIVLMIIIWLLGKRPKKQPYEYLFDQKQQEGTLPYVPDTRFDQPYTPHLPSPEKAMILPFTTEGTKTRIYKNFQEAAEYNTGWLNAETQTLNLDTEDEVILSHWTPLQVLLKKSFGDSLKSFIMLCFYFSIYAVISYFVTMRSGDAKAARDAAMQALFFPLFPYILISYRSLDKYIKALGTAFFLMVAVFIPLSANGFISGEGIPFLKYFLFIDKYFEGLSGLLAQATGTETYIQFTNRMLIIVFAFEFILMIVYAFIKTRPYIHTVISKKAIFIRAKTKKSVFEIIKLVFWIIFNPFNIKQYKDIRDRVKYNRMTALEGHHHDFSRVPYDSIEKLKIHKHNIRGTVFLLILMMGVGILTLKFFIGFGLIGIAIVLLLRTMRFNNTYRITLDVKRSKVEGSWILSHQSDIFEFDRVPESITQYFRQI
ncbi:hypothetical protein NEF87_001262 [Candidatus Lokiarchaeum ossiferum]|uniref:Uncharacterized protein n=1 Tax=Candidatus Lokiarchaeum ossiferum TaxID=2951803 RepID=A0ABY6HRF8_9ARCH|nr:hypothetical protein NEF87_001262 [Candidatus Lokiarchaeum sp. B-35]